jgi:hypothetical protein
MGRKLLVLGMGVQRGDSRQIRRRIWQIFVTFQSNGDAYLGFRAVRAEIVRSRGSHHPQYAPTAAYRHALAQCDLRGHTQGEFDFGPFGQSRIGNEEDSAGTEILGESDAFHRPEWLAQRKGQRIWESLSDAAFNPDWRSGHGVTSFGEAPKKASAIL